MTTITPVQELPNLEGLLHEEFGEQKPSEEQTVEFLEKRNVPRNDGGISIAIAVAALLLQGWSTYREEQRRKSETPPPPPTPPVVPSQPPPPPICPVVECGLEPALTLNTGEYICMNGHKWKAN